MDTRYIALVGTGLNQISKETYVYEIRAGFRKKADNKVRTECVNVLILKYLS